MGIVNVTPDSFSDGGQFQGHDAAIAHALAPGGVTVLSGLLVWQENLVASFYRPHGLVLRARYRDGMWSALRLERPMRSR